MASLGTAILELKSTLIDSGIDRNDPLFLRFAEIEIEASALLLAPPGATPDDIRVKLDEIARSSLEQRLSDVATDFLGWYLLPDETRGQNEAPIGPVHARKIRQQFHKRWIADSALHLQLRDEVADFLSKRAQAISAE